MEHMKKNSAMHQIQEKEESKLDADFLEMMTLQPEKANLLKAGDERERLAIKGRLSDIEDRLKGGGSVDETELALLKKAIDQRGLELEMEVAKKRPVLDEFLGRVELDSLPERVQCKELSRYMAKDMQPQNAVERALLDQMAALHKTSIDILAQISLNCEEEGISLSGVQRVVNMSTRLMDLYQRGAQTLYKLRNGGKQTVIVQHQNVQVNDGGQAIVTEIIQRGVGDGDAA